MNKKALVISVLSSTLLLSACGQDEALVDPVKTPETIEKEVDKKATEGKPSVDPALVDPNKEPKKESLVKDNLKEAEKNSKEISLAKKAFAKGTDAGRKEAQELLFKAQDKGHLFKEIFFDEIEKLSDKEKAQYEKQKDSLKPAISAAEIFLSDKYEGSEKQSFYFSKKAVAEDIAVFETEFDNKEKEIKFLTKNEKGDWVVFETKKEKLEREKSQKARLAAKKK